MGKVSEKQLNDFPKQLLYKERAIFHEHREVYSTFDPKREKTLPANKDVTDSASKEEIKKLEDKSNKNATTDPQNHTSTETDVTNAQAKPTNGDSFEIIGDDTSYLDENISCS